MKNHLNKKWTFIRQVSILDDTLTETPGSIKFHGQWNHHFTEDFAKGMKHHTEANKDSVLIHSMLITAAKVQDITPVSDHLYGKADNFVR